MLRHTRLALVTAATAGLIAAGGALAPASADSPSSPVCSRGGCGGPGSGSQSTNGQQVSVSVSGSLVKGGSEGSGGSTSVTVHSPCYYWKTLNGKELYQAFKNHYKYGPNGKIDKPPKGWKKHKKDTKGYWYYPQDDGSPHWACGNFVFSDAIFVEPGQAVPTPQVPPEVLLEAATKAMDIPDPVFEENPHVRGENVTLVNLPTWFWMRQGLPHTGEVTATAAGHSATVTMNMNDVTFASPDAGSVSCPDGGTAWTAGAQDSECTLSFPHASDASPVTATTRWTGSWSYDGAPRGAVDPVTATWSDDLGVQEVQTVVTGTD